MPSRRFQGLVGLVALVAFAVVVVSAEDGSCPAGQTCPDVDDDEKGWPDEDDAMHMDVQELRAEYKLHRRQMKQRFLSGEISESVYQRKRRRMRKHFNALLNSVEEVDGFEKDTEKADPVLSISTGCTSEHGVDYPCNHASCANMDFRFVRDVQTSNACCEQCKADARCVYWTWAGPDRKPAGQRHVCWLKTAAAKEYRTFVGPSTALVSGYIANRAAPTVQILEDTANKKDAKSKKSDGKMGQSQYTEEVKDSQVKTSKKGEQPDASPKKSKVVDPKKNSENIRRGRELERKAETLMHEGSINDALSVFSEAVRLIPSSGSVHFRHGIALERAGQRAEAAAAYEKALAANDPKLPANEIAMAYNNLGLQYKEHFKRYQAAEEAYRASIRVAEEGGMTSFHYPYKNLGQMFEKNGRAADAIPLFDKAASMTGDDGLRMYSALLLPYVYEDQEDMAMWRRRFVKNVKSLAKKGIRIPHPENMDGVPQYYLSYHGKNDSKINARIARMFRAASPQVEYLAPHVKGYTPPRGGAKIKLGFMSYYFRAHSVSKMVAGLFKHLDKSRFAVTIFHCGFIDDTTRLLERLSQARLVHMQHWELLRMQRAIADERLDVLVYAEIGMDPHAYALAMGRLAPVQLAMHGHACTTGVPTIDYYVSYEGFSEPEAQEHYSERLLILPGLTPLPLWYDIEPLPISPAARTPAGRKAFRRRFGLPEEATVYACLQTVFKVDPRLDEVARRILEADPAAVVVFKELPMTDQVGQLVKARMRKQLSEALMARVVFLPPVSERDYADAYGAVDVLLDSFPFGGHTTTMDAFSAACPVVTLPTDLMSGRCTQGFLRFLGLDELVARSLDDYVDKALRIGRDPAYRARLSRRIEEGLGRLKKDRTSVEAWHALLEALVRKDNNALAQWLAPPHQPFQW